MSFRIVDRARENPTLWRTEKRRMGGKHLPMENGRIKQPTGRKSKNSGQHPDHFKKTAQDAIFFKSAGLKRYFRPTFDGSIFLRLIHRRRVRFETSRYFAAASKVNQGVSAIDTSRI